jgi:hypothetical protein
VSIATGSKLLFAAQVEQCYLNIATALAVASATFDDVPKVTIHAVDWVPDKMPLLLDGLGGRRRGWGSSRSRRAHCWASRHWTGPSIWSRARPSPFID